MGRKIIAVDDSDVARDLVVATLAEFGYDDIETFADPRAALDALSAPGAMADLVLLDIMMPGMDGIELCARLRQIDHMRDVPVVMLTSRTDKASLSRAFLAGANDYLMKPFEHVEFQARLKAQLRLKAELDRRKALIEQQRAPRAVGGPRRHAPGLLGDRETLLDALSTLDAGEPVAIYAISIDALAFNAADFSEGQQEQIVAAVSRALAGMEMSAGNILVRWERETFCGACIVGNEAELRNRLTRMLDRIGEVLADMRDTLRESETTASAALSISAGGRPASAVLGDAFDTLDSMRTARETGLRLSGKSALCN